MPIGISRNYCMNLSSAGHIWSFCARVPSGFQIGQHLAALHWQAAHAFFFLIAARCQIKCGLFSTNHGALTWLHVTFLFWLCRYSNVSTAIDLKYVVSLILCNCHTNKQVRQRILWSVCFLHSQITSPLFYHTHSKALLTGLCFPSNLRWWKTELKRLKIKQLI